MRMKACCSLHLRMILLSVTLHQGLNMHNPQIPLSGGCRVMRTVQGMEISDPGML